MRINVTERSLDELTEIILGFSNSGYDGHIERWPDGRVELVLELRNRRIHVRANRSGQGGHNPASKAVAGMAPLG